MSRDSPRLQGILKGDYFEGASTGPLLGLNQGESPRSTPKSVSIARHAETISPLMLGTQKDVDDFDLDRDRSSWRPKVKGPSSKRLSGRPPHNASITSLQSLVDEPSGDSEEMSTSASPGPGFMGQVQAWLKDEKTKQLARNAKRKVKAAATAAGSAAHHYTDAYAHHHRRKSSASSNEEGVDLDRLEQILKDTFPFARSAIRRGSNSIRRRPSIRKLHKASSAGASSDTDYFEGDVLVPSAEAWLDNSKTLAYGGGAADSMDDTSIQSEKTRTREAWSVFKYEIVRLTHTLRLKGWRRVRMEMSGEIGVERLSGALTNAVYVVSPPARDLPARPSSTDDTKPPPKRQPPKLLLRIYGPQVEHLIDREAELQILRRLARKRIGPRMLGTFSNGRFEEFFNARTLAPKDLRNEDTSRQIAKRMRELHDGIDLLDQEREDGPFVFRNWDKWVQRVEEVVSWLDGQIKHHDAKIGLFGSDVWKTRGLVCGTEWAVFKETVVKYREWIDARYGGDEKLGQELVFAHNDTQYGNILRLVPTGASPLLLPVNTHKQLVVIDFEYASANTPGLEFANHFTEWCYNYHDADTPWQCNTSAYPTPEEQASFIRAYVRHRPDFNLETPATTPLETVPESRAISPSKPGEVATTDKRPPGPSQSISNFILDARIPASSAVSTTASPAVAAEKAEALAAEDKEVRRLLHETQMWRLANSAQWVAWGIVQAKVPGMPIFSPSEASTLPSVTTSMAEDVDSSADGEQGGAAPGRDTVGEKEVEEEKAEEEFDYLAYARDRAMFFWGDAVGLGLVELAQLPADVCRDIKIVKY